MLLIDLVPEQTQLNGRVVLWLELITLTLLIISGIKFQARFCIKWNLFTITFIPIITMHWISCAQWLLFGCLIVSLNRLYLRSQLVLALLRNGCGFWFKLTCWCKNQFDSITLMSRAVPACLINDYGVAMFDVNLLIHFVPMLNDTLMLTSNQRNYAIFIFMAAASIGFAIRIGYTKQIIAITLMTCVIIQFILWIKVCLICIHCYNDHFDSLSQWSQNTFCLLIPTMTLMVLVPVTGWLCCTIGDICSCIWWSSRSLLLSLVNIFHAGFPPLKFIFSIFKLFPTLNIFTVISLIHSVTVYLCVMLIHVFKYLPSSCWYFTSRKEFTSLNSQILQLDAIMYMMEAVEEQAMEICKVLGLHNNQIVPIILDTGGAVCVVSKNFVSKFQLGKMVEPTNRSWW